MTVKQLRDILVLYPDEMLIITALYSDYVDLQEPRVIEVLPRRTTKSYLRYYLRQHEGPPADLTKVLYFEGN